MIYILNQENNEGYEFLALQCLVGMLVFLKQSNNYSITQIRLGPTLPRFWNP